jgi:hypothetical protein
MSLRLPREQGFGIALKKGERINIAADFGITSWGSFRMPGTDPSELKDEYRISAGMTYVPEKYAAGRGALGRRMNYRFGFTYKTGFLKIQNQAITDRFVSIGLGIPVGIARLSSMVNVSAQFGQLGAGTNGIISENYVRVHFGFTFSDRWFQKFRYE